MPSQRSLSTLHLLPLHPHHRSPPLTKRIQMILCKFSPSIHSENIPSLCTTQMISQLSLPHKHPSVRSHLNILLCAQLSIFLFQLKNSSIFWILTCKLFVFPIILKFFEIFGIFTLGQNCFLICVRFPNWWGRCDFGGSGGSNNICRCNYGIYFM